MKKRYIASPLLVVLIVAGWQVALRQSAQPQLVEASQSYLNPEVSDVRHPIDIFHVGLNQGDTEGDVLAQLPTEIYPQDRVKFLMDPKLGLGTIVSVERAMPITIQDGKRTIFTRTWASTVGELLDDFKRPLADLDRATVKEADLLTPNMTIEITRVSKTNLTQTETIAFETTTKDDPNIDRGTTKVVEPGENGVRTKVYEITREDGEEISRKLIQNDVTQKPKNKIIAKGTRIKIGKTATGKATWYDLCCSQVASTTFKKGTVLRLTNLSSGKQIEVTVEDTGAFGGETVVDLHPSLFTKLGGSLGSGTMSRVKAEEILNP